MIEKGLNLRDKDKGLEACNFERDLSEPEGHWDIDRKRD